MRSGLVLMAVSTNELVHMTGGEQPFSDVGQALKLRSDVADAINQFKSADCSSNPAERKKKVQEFLKL